MSDHFICILCLYFRSLAVARPDEVQELAAPVTTYTVLEKGTESQGRLLVQSLGCSYRVKHTNKSSTVWRCTVRNKKQECKANVKQTNDTFVRGPTCMPTATSYYQPELLATAKVNAKVKLMPFGNI